MVDELQGFGTDLMRVQHLSEIQRLKADNARLKEELEMYKRAPEVVMTGGDTAVLK